MQTDSTNCSFDSRTALRHGNFTFHFDKLANTNISSDGTITFTNHHNNEITSTYEDDPTVSLTDINCTHYEPLSTPSKPKRFSRQAPGHDEYLTKPVIKVLTRDIKTVYSPAEICRRYQRRGGSWSGRNYRRQ